MSRSAPDRPAFRPLTWAIFLGVSWTWCIGMYLPVLLVRDYGLAGWIVFAIPNVIGAAAMGWVLKDAEASRRFVERHGAACVFFSAITVCFHLFFAAFVIAPLIGNWALIFLGLALILATIPAIARQTPRAALGVFVFSVAMAVAVFSSHGAGGHSLTAVAPGQSMRSPLRLSGLALVCLFGFAFCPYLDLTFHRARQHTSPSGGRLAFGLGFGLFFLAMILFTLGYSPYLLRSPWSALPAAVAGAIGFHMVVQAGFTIDAHLYELRGVNLGASMVGFAVGTGLIAAWMDGLIPARAGISPGELTYRLFMSFYGLLFPAYVWWSMLGRNPLTRRQWPLAIVALAICTPCYWLAFIEGRMSWVIPGVAIAVLLPLLPFAKDRGVEHLDGVEHA